MFPSPLYHFIYLHHIISTLFAMDEKEILLYLNELRQWDANGIAPEGDHDQYIAHIIKTVAPAAEELGMEHEQHEMQDLAVKIGFPEDYKKLKKLLLDSEMTCEMVFKTFSLPIRAMLDDMGIEYEFKCRMKSVYSIWRKMRNDNKQFDDVYDLFATRIIYKPKEIIDSLPQTGPNTVDQLTEVASTSQWQLSNMDAEKFYCWRIYTVISMLYRIHPDRIKDWITHPKKSGYQALQLTVMGPDCNWIEIQIRSERMHYEAEYGSAAHWKYKQESNAM